MAMENDMAEADERRRMALPQSVAPDALLARFRSSQALDDAIEKLETAGFGREDLGLPDLAPPIERATPEAGSGAADTKVEAEQARMFHASVGGSFAALMAATAVAATGGAVAAITGAAIGVGAAVAGVAHLLSRSLSHSERTERDQKAAAGRLYLAVRVINQEGRERAATILRQAGAELIDIGAG